MKIFNQNILLAAEFNKAIESNPDIQSAITNTTFIEILTPLDVLKLFERIPERDIPLLAMDSKRSRPKDLVLSRMLVPPVCIRPSVISDLKPGTYVLYFHKYLINPRKDFVLN